MENSDILKYSVMILLCAGFIGSVSYNVMDTGNELVCRTNKPTGWEFVDMHEIGNMTIYEAVCPYTTKEPVYANCSGFRDTGSYLRYGCDEVLLVVEAEEVIVQKQERATGLDYHCATPENGGCEV